MVDRFLRGLARPSTFLPFLLCCIVGFITAASVFNGVAVSIFFNGFDIAICVLIDIAYMPVLWHSIRAPNPTKEQYLVSGILLAWNAIAFSRGWVMAAIMMGRPAWMLNHWVLSLCYAMVAMSGFYFLKVPGKVNGGWRYVTIALVLAVAIITVFLIYMNGAIFNG